MQQSILSTPREPSLSAIHFPTFFHTEQCVHIMKTEHDHFGCVSKTMH